MPTGSALAPPRCFLSQCHSPRGCFVPRWHAVHGWVGVGPRRLRGHRGRGTGICGSGGAQEGRLSLLICPLWPLPQVVFTKQVIGVNFSQCLCCAAEPPPYLGVGCLPCGRVTTASQPGLWG